MKNKPSTRSILVTGASGQLGPYVLRRLAAEGHALTAWSGRRTGTLFGVPLCPVDVASPEALKTAFAAAAPDVVVHLAAVSGVHEACRNPNRATAVNTRGTETLAELCRERASRLIYLSTDLVFDGEGAPYREEDTPSPLSVYGRTKLAVEPAVLGLNALPPPLAGGGPGRGLVLRVSLLFGPSLSGGTTFFDQQVSALREGRPIHLFQDEWRTPLSLPAAAAAIAAAVASKQTGLLHLGGPDRLSRYEMGCLLAEHIGADPSVLLATSRLKAPGEPRPRDTSLDSSRWNGLFPEVRPPSYRDAVAELLRKD